MMGQKEKFRRQILGLVKKYYFAEAKEKEFIPGKTRINYSGRVYDEKELVNLVDSALEFWLTAGRYAAEFEKRLAHFIGVKYCSLVNSGSSANLLAVSALASPKLGERAIQKGEEIITVAAGFPTTITPIVQNGFVPVFVDVELPSYNVGAADLEKAVSKKTRAVILAHTLGNPFNINAVKKFCRAQGLWLIEDNCDSLGSKYQGKFTGSFGDIATCSFYPPHHMSCSKNTPIPYLNEEGKWHLDKIENIFSLYATKPEKIKILSFDQNNKVGWTIPASILRHKLGQKRMIKITCQHGREVEVTEDHSVFVIDKKSVQIVPQQASSIGVDDYIVVTNKIAFPEEIKFIDVIDCFLDKNAFVAGFSLSNLRYVNDADQRWQFKNRDSLPIKYLKEYDLGLERISVGISQSQKIPGRIPVNNELCRLIGYFMAEGSYQDGLIFSFNRKELNLINDVKKIVKSIFGMQSSVKATNNSAVIRVKSKNLEMVFRDIFMIGHGDRYKRIPCFLYHSNETRIKSFIYGYTKGDGSIRKRKNNSNSIDVTSVSLDLLNDFQYLLSMIGISASFYKRNNSKKKKIGKVWTINKENFTLCFGGYIYKGKTIIETNLKNRNTFSQQIPLLDIFRKNIALGKNQKVISRKRLARHLTGSQWHALVNGDLGFFKVRSIKEINYDKNEYVYDFSVPGQENFYGGFLGMFLHNTMGEGGAVLTDNLQLKRIIESLRDWGRDCFCPSGQDDSCKKRFKWKLGDLPFGYDHKYIYSHFGYNLKATDLQASIGCAQLDKLPSFIEARRKNWRILRDGLDCLSDVFILPEAEEGSTPSWFGFLLTVIENSGFTREKIVAELEERNIQTRMLFAGNMVKHPCFDAMRASKKDFRTIGKLRNTDLVMNNAFWIGVYPGMTEEKLRFMVDSIKNIIGGKT